MHTGNYLIFKYHVATECKNLGNRKDTKCCSPRNITANDIIWMDISITS